MEISLGIVGLPNSGKSTFFNALIAEKKSLTAVTPFTTILHKDAKAKVDDVDLNILDIAGLVQGSHQGKGVGNMFLEKIRKVDILIHVVRAFYSPFVEHLHRKHEPGSLHQVLEDIEVIREELRVAGIHKPVIYVLNFDENKFFKGVTNEFVSLVEHKYDSPVIPVCAKVEESLIEMTEEERLEVMKNKNIDEPSIYKIAKTAAFLYQQKSLN